MTGELKDIPGYEGRFAVTRDGRVWSYPKPTTGAIKGGLKKGKWLKLTNSGGYRVVGLGKRDSQTVHRLVATTYLERQAGLDYVNHISGVRHDNRVENLEWCTKSHDTKHAYLAGLHKPPRKIPPGDIPVVRQLAASGVSQANLAKKFGVGRATIQRVIHGTHGYGETT